MNFCIHCGNRLLLGDRYRAYRPTGEGQSSRTFLGLDTKKITDPRCVIKQFFNQDQADQFRQEVVQLDRIGQHPQIPDLYAYYEREHQQFLVQEFVEGRSLLKQLQEEGTFSEAQVLDLLRDLLPVLHFLHEQRIIHRDVKPDNLIRRNPDQSLILVDLGAIKHASESALARPGTVIGSAEYVAPEQLMGKAIFSSDLYSLGASCIHLLTGLSPFELFNSTDGTWFWRSVAGPVSDRLSHILDTLLQYSPQQRYGSAAEALHDLNLPLPAPAATVYQASTVQTPLTWDCLHTLDHTSPLQAIALNSDSQTLASGGNDGVIRVWDIGSGQFRVSWKGHSGAIASLALSPDGTYLASGSWDRTINLWNVQTGECLKSLTGHTNVVTALEFSQDGQTLFSSSRDRTIRLWEMTTGTQTFVFSGHKGQVEAIALSPTAKMLISGDDQGMVNVWHLGTKELLRTLPGHLGAVKAIALSPDGDTVISGSWDMTIKLRNSHTGGIRHTLSGHLLPIATVSISSSGLIATGSHDSTIRVWTLENGQLVSTLTEHTAAVEAVLFSADSGQLVSASQDGQIKIWRCV